MLNFLSNALKFTLHGGTVKCFIEIIDEQKIGEERYVDFRISIQDTGVGISQQNIERLFIDFNKM